MGAFTKVALALLLCTIAGAYIEHHSATAYFSHALAGANEDEFVVIHGSTYRVTNGNVFIGNKKIEGEAQLPALRLAYEKVMVRRTPILGIAGSDPAALDQATLALASSSAQLAALQSTQRANSAVAKSLYPIDFLHALAKLEVTRQAFLANGGESEAHAYNDALSDALERYREDLAKFSRGFNTFVPLTAPPYATERSVLTRADVLRAIGSLQTAANAALWHARIRSLCVAGITIACTPQDLSLASETPVAAARGALDISSRTRALFHVAGSIDANDAPIVELQSSDCVRDDKAPIFLVREQGSPLARFFFLGDLRFVRTADEQRTPLYAAFAAQGVSYAPTQPTAYYECVHAASDWARVAATRAVAQLAKDSPLSTFATGDLQKKLRGIEGALASTNVREADAISYIDLSNELPAVAVPSSAREALATVTLALRDRSADFDSFVASIADGEALNVQRARRGTLRSNDAATLFYTRSAFASLFLSQNPLVVSAPLAFRENTADRAEQPFVWLSELPASTDPALSRSIARFRELSHI